MAAGSDSRNASAVVAEPTSNIASGPSAASHAGRDASRGHRARARGAAERAPRPQPVQVKTLAMELPTDAWQTITWREGSNMLLTSRFTRLRVRPAPQAAGRSELAAEQWLLIEWPVGEPAPDHYWLSTLSADIEFERMVDLAKLRWRIERDYLELKQEVGPGRRRT